MSLTALSKSGFSGIKAKAFSTLASTINVQYLVIAGGGGGRGRDGS